MLVLGLLVTVLVASVVVEEVKLGGSMETPNTNPWSDK